LHFGVRAGQRSDYSSIGDWRWQAGWVKSDPRSMGWLQPSKVIAEQGPGERFIRPPDWFFKVWGTEILVTLIFVFFAVFSYVVATKKHKPIILLFSGFCFGLVT
jgi:hypothetical protein